MNDVVGSIDIHVHPAGDPQRTPAPLANWGAAWASQRGIAKHHNTMQFLTTLYLYVRESGAEFQELVVPSIVAAIKPLL